MTMAPQFVIIYYSVFLLWLLNFVNFTNAQDEALECMIKDGEIEIHLKLQRTEQLLANENLPIWTASPRKGRGIQRFGSVNHKRQRNFMKDHIGSFVLYHDKEKSAAVTYFAKTRTLMGVIDMRYLITNLPLNECNQGHQLGGNYVKKLGWSGFTDFHQHFKPLDLSMHAKKRFEDIDAKPSTLGEDNPQTTLYPEIMLFVPHSITKIVKASNQNNYLANLVGHYIVYFNAIDMLISKLATDNIKIRLNLAGIVIEQQGDAFDFITSLPELPQGPHPDVPHIDAVNTLNRVPQYIFQNNDIFPQDSFDFYFIITNRALWSTQLNGEASGISIGGDPYERRRGGSNDGLLSGTLVRNLRGMEYITASHEIAHLISIDHDPLNKGYRYLSSQCYAIMQKVNDFCPDCLKWSDESIEQLKKYVRDDRKRCYLLNSPRSLHPYGSRLRTLSSSDQCRCYGFQPRTPNHMTGYENMMPEDFCNANLICATGPDEGLLPLPVDGTPCAEDKVCWNQFCQTIRNAM